MRISFLTILLACTALPLTAVAEKVVDPIKEMQQASHTHKTQTIKGVLTVYWQEQKIRLAMNSDLASQKQLYRNTPNQKRIEHTRADMKFVDLHWRGSQTQLQQALYQAFGSNVTAPFWQNRRGILHLPATVAIKDFQLYDAVCDQYYFQADIVSISRDQSSQVKPIYTEPCANGIEMNRYRVSASDGYANLRKAPNTNAPVQQRLTNQTTLLELGKKGAWIEVQVIEQERNRAVGFVHQSQVTLMDGE